MPIASGLEMDLITVRGLAQAYGLRRTGALAESFSRAAGVAPVTLTPTTGKQYFTALYVPGGTTLSNFTFLSVGAAGTPTNQFATLYDAGFNRLVLGVDKTTAAWNANSESTFALASSYQVSTDTLLYVGLTQVATTPATLVSSGLSAAFAALLPVAGFADTANTLTNPASAPAVATNSAGSAPLFAWAS